MAKKSIPADPATEKRDFYVYILFDWMGIPRYVGKGCGARWLKHELKTDPFNWMKNEFIERAWIMLGEVPKVKVRENVTNADARITEIALIRAIGRIDKMTGPLTNMTDGGDGVDSDTARKMWGRYTPEQRSQILRERQQAIPEAVRSEIARERSAKLTDEQRQEIGRNLNSSRSSESRRLVAQEVCNNRSFETRSRASIKRWKTLGEDRQSVIINKLTNSRTTEERSEGAKTWKATRTPEELSAIGKKSWEHRKRNWGTEITAFGRTRYLSEWAAELGTATTTITCRLAHGWTPERAVSQTPGKYVRKT